MTIIFSTGSLDWDQIQGNVICVVVIVMVLYCIGRKLGKNDADQDTEGR